MKKVLRAIVVTLPFCSLMSCIEQSRASTQLSNTSDNEAHTLKCGLIVTGLPVKSAAGSESISWTPIQGDDARFLYSLDKRTTQDFDLKGKDLALDGALIATANVSETSDANGNMVPSSLGIGIRQVVNKKAVVEAAVSLPPDFLGQFTLRLMNVQSNTLGQVNLQCEVSK